MNVDLGELLQMLNICMRYKDFQQLFERDAMLRNRTNKTTPATPKTTSKSHEDEPNLGNGEQTSDAVLKGYSGPVVAVVELPLKQTA